MQTLKELGEDAVVRRLTDGIKLGDSVLVGPGDDCAVIDQGGPGNYQLLKTDCIVAGVHYEEGESARRVGWKAVARVISDFAAMGGGAENILVTIAVSPDRTIGYLEDLYAGMQKCADLYGANICGGETSSVPDAASDVISIAGTGSVCKNQLVTRAGGRPGDKVLVTGRLGGSISGKHLDFTPRVEEANWLTKHFDLTAMMDLSDGVARDLPRMSAASGCGVKIYRDDVPCSPGVDLKNALEDGEDYELMFAVSSERIQYLLEKWNERFPELPLTVIGALCDVADGEKLAPAGWEHFSKGVGDK